MRSKRGVGLESGVTGTENKRGSRDLGNVSPRALLFVAPRWIGIREMANIAMLANRVPEPELRRAITDISGRWLAKRRRCSGQHSRKSPNGVNNES